MKSRTKPALRALPAAQVQISLPVQGVLRDVRHAFLGLCIDAGQKVLAALMESDRIAQCGAAGVPDARRPLFGVAPRPARSCWAASVSRCAGP
jgi:putative transposase